MGERTVVIVGGGLVGSLSACYFAKRGWSVILFEKRPDVRLPENTDLVEHRSINLAISERGFSALRRLDADLEKRVKQAVVPMNGRMVHTLDGSQMSQAYDVFGKHINSVGRSALIQLLLDEAETSPGVSLRFCHEFVSADLDSGAVTIANLENKGIATVHADLIVGADGAHSKVRRQMMPRTMMNYSQTYIEHGYCEFAMAPRDGEFAMDPNHLHIWPRGSFMLIALPNPDKSFTCTLFMPWSRFDAIKTGDDIVAFFRSNFPDALQLIGEAAVRFEYTANPKGSLMYLKCTPYTYKGKAVILGDAAHAMVPFYGQGMNCGFEDVESLDRIMLDVLNRNRAQDDSSNRTVLLTDDQLATALSEYSASRTEDASAIVDLALENYVEMRAKVVSYTYLLRKHLEGFLHRMFPRSIIPLYTMVSFTSIPYSTVVRRWQRQTDWIQRSIKAAAIALSIGAGVIFIRAMRGNASTAHFITRVARLLSRQTSTATTTTITA
ncbi:kynurenine 3-monooxygenase, mitochondrial precursor [Coemansia sp. Benny D160-2]|nr:kynurenine 3-monooxygenase, mitochondrial precursor [Coemansia sp. Benny D160-2]